MAALRVLLHLHDYTAYVGWDEKTSEKYTGFAMFLLDPLSRNPWETDMIRTPAVPQTRATPDAAQAGGGLHKRT